MATEKRASDGKLKIGSFVTYQTGGGTNTLRAKVLRNHKDGSVTVEPYFLLDEAGNDLPGFFGGKVRLYVADVRPLTQQDS